MLKMTKLTSIISSSSSCVGLLPGTGTIAIKNTDFILSSKLQYPLMNSKTKILLWIQRHLSFSLQESLMNSKTPNDRRTAPNSFVDTVPSPSWWFPKSFCQNYFAIQVVFKIIRSKLFCHPGGFQNYFVKFIIFMIRTLSNIHCKSLRSEPYQTLWKSSWKPRYLRLTSQQKTRMDVVDTIMKAWLEWWHNILIGGYR